MEVKMRTKTKIFLLWALALFICTVTSCKNDGNKPNLLPIPDCVTVKPVNVDTITVKSLDDYFNDLCWKYQNGHNGYPTIYAINSYEELENINKGYIDRAQIDFEQYTLVGGIFHISPYPYEILLENLCKNDFLKTYTKKFIIKKGMYMQVTYHYFWALYPKLHSEYQVNLDLDISPYEEEIE